MRLYRPSMHLRMQIRIANSEFFYTSAQIITKTHEAPRNRRTVGPALWPDLPVPFSFCRSGPTVRRISHSLKLKGIEQLSLIYGEENEILVSADWNSEVRHISGCLNMFILPIRERRWISLSSWVFKKLFFSSSILPSVLSETAIYNHLSKNYIAIATT